MSKNPYTALGVDANASRETIQAAYQCLAKELHDASPQTEAVREMQEAYSVLSDPDRVRAFRQRLRSTSSAAEPLRPKRAPAEPLGAVEQAIEFSLPDGSAEFHPSFDELFDRLWSNFTLLTRPKAEQIESLTLDIPLTVEEGLRGGQARVMIPTRAACPACSGRGSVGPYECWRCEGHGALTAEYPLEVPYPSGILNEYVVRLPLAGFGIGNFYLTVRFRVTAGTF